jgi:hypothetical protein
VTRGSTWIVVGLVLTGSVVAWLLGSTEAATGVAIAIGLVATSYVGTRMATDADRDWLPTIVLLAFLTKMLASMARWGVLEFVYGGSGDATGYHGEGTRLVAVWRSFDVPDFEVGTEFVNSVTGFLYIPYVPTFLGGFIIFATMAFFGQILLYAAFRKTDSSGRLGWYAAAVFFLPTIVYWPSSIGKESLMFLFLGTASYAAAGLMKDYRIRWAALFAVGIAGSAAVRPHVALLLVGSLAVAMVFSKNMAAKGLGGRRLIAIISIGLVLGAATVAAAAKFNINFTEGLAATEDIERVIENVEGATSKGGSAVTGSSISSPAEFPAGFVKVLFRPFPTEATTIQVLATSIEGMLLFGLLLWRIVPMVRYGRHIRRTPYILFALVFTIGFVIAFSSFNNFGLLARQRSQVIPYFMAVLITYGWKPYNSGREDSKSQPAGADPLPHESQNKGQAITH